MIVGSTRNAVISRSEAGPETAALNARRGKPLSRACARDHLNRCQESLSAASWGVDCMIARGHGAATNSHSGRSSIVSAPSLCTGPHRRDSRICGHVHGPRSDTALKVLPVVPCGVVRA
jgi:hypothetical protein